MQFFALRCLWNRLSVIVRRSAAIIVVFATLFSVSTLHGQTLPGWKL
jgi:hypothetical protein